jgi:hypothetical protein
MFWLAGCSDKASLQHSHGALPWLRDTRSSAEMLVIYIAQLCSHQKNLVVQPVLARIATTK